MVHRLSDVNLKDLEFSFLRGIEVYKYALVMPVLLVLVFAFFPFCHVAESNHIRHKVCSSLHTPRTAVLP